TTRRTRPTCDRSPSPPCATCERSRRTTSAPRRVWTTARTARSAPPRYSCPSWGTGERWLTRHPVCLRFKHCVRHGAHAGSIPAGSAKRPCEKESVMCHTSWARHAPRSEFHGYVRHGHGPGHSDGAGGWEDESMGRGFGEEGG